MIILFHVDNTDIRSICPQLVEKFHVDVRTNGKIDLTFFGSVIFRGAYGDDGSFSCDQQHYTEGMTKKWLLEDRDVSSSDDL